MDVSTEAKRIMVQALGKLYSSRSQRGGLRLHRSLLLTLVMKSARDIYHSVHMACENEAKTTSSDPQQLSTDEAMDTSDAKAETSTSDCAPVASPGEDKPCQGESKAASAGFKRSQENKENLRSLGPDRHSRKRRGKATAEPDFLPSKRAKMEVGEENQVIRSTALRSNSANCNRAMTALTSLPLSQVIAAF
ncbi:immediate early response gene 2 protein-like [Anguilla anguilla]|uniref:immediate early response gene 2 protein-like n=1 Tax=Anguilla anguilla TaxID=7936 RepID=UPI0015AD6B11|nr:immediate early response gene 2 protein-like [Anguilla anguilla]